jgi:hypothetical protein
MIRPLAAYLFAALFFITSAFASPQLTIIADQTDAPPALRQPLNSMDKLTLEEIERLSFIFENDLLDSGNSEYLTYFNKFPFSKAEFADLRLKFVVCAAKGVVQLLQENPKNIIRLLGRDTNEVFEYLEILLSPDNLELGLSNAEKDQLLRRVLLIPASRALISEVASRPNASLLFKSIFSLSDKELHEKNILFLDLGFEGSIPKMFETTRISFLNTPNIRWHYVWRSKKAPATIDLWPLPGLNEQMTENQKAIFYDERDYQTFRVVLMEHFPKWTRRAIGPSDAPLFVMLDLDDTVLKEVSIENQQNQLVKTLRYEPGAAIREKYQLRLQNSSTSSKDAGKVIHYKFITNAVIESTVVLRPTIEMLIDGLREKIRAGQVRLLITSNNDPARTQAVFEQLKIGADTLRDLGAEVIEQKRFQGEAFKKDFTLLRTSLNIPASSTIFAIDDLAENFIGSGKNNHVLAVSPFTGDYVKDSLAGEVSELQLNDRLALGRISESVLAATLQFDDAQTEANRVRALAFSAGLAATAKLNSPPSSSELFSCRQLFSIGGR